MNGTRIPTQRQVAPTSNASGNQKTNLRRIDYFLDRVFARTNWEKDVDNSIQSGLNGKLTKDSQIDYLLEQFSKYDRYQTELGLPRNKDEHGNTLVRLPITQQIEFEKKIEQIKKQILAKISSLQANLVSNNTNLFARSQYVQLKGRLTDDLLGKLKTLPTTRTSSPEGSTGGSLSEQLPASTKSSEGAREKLLADARSRKGPEKSQSSGLVVQSSATSNSPKLPKTVTDINGKQYSTGKDTREGNNCGVMAVVEAVGGEGATLRYDPQAARNELAEFRRASRIFAAVLDLTEDVPDNSPIQKYDGFKEAYLETLKENDADDARSKHEKTVKSGLVDRAKSFEDLNVALRLAEINLLNLMYPDFSTFKTGYLESHGTPFKGNPDNKERHEFKLKLIKDSSSFEDLSNRCGRAFESNLDSAATGNKPPFKNLTDLRQSIFKDFRDAAPPITDDCEKSGTFLEEGDITYLMSRHGYLRTTQIGSNTTVASAPVDAVPVLEFTKVGSGGNIKAYIANNANNAKPDTAPKPELLTALDNGSSSSDKVSINKARGSHWFVVTPKPLQAGGAKTGRESVDESSPSLDGSPDHRDAYNY